MEGQGFGDFQVGSHGMYRKHNTGPRFCMGFVEGEGSLLCVL